MLKNFAAVRMAATQEIRYQAVNKLPLVNASGINCSELRSPTPKLRKPNGWVGMPTSTCSRR